MEQGIEVNIIAEEIIKLSNGVEKLLSSGLNNRAILILLHDAIGSTAINKKQIQSVLNALPQLKKLYIKEDKK